MTNTGARPRSNKPLLIMWSLKPGVWNGPFLPASWRQMNWNLGGACDVKEWREVIE